MGGEVLGVKIQGLAESMQSLALFGDELVGKWGHKATFNAADVIRNQAIANAPILQVADDRRVRGALRDAIAVFKRKDTGIGQPLYIVGVRRIKIGSKLKRVLRTLKKSNLSLNLQNDVFYAHLQEFGWHDRSGKFHPGTRYMTRAFESTKEQSLEAFSLTLSQGVVAAVAKAKR